MNGVTAWLWTIYGRTYDGLLGFWPYQNLLNVTLEALPLAASDYILDAGCGTGNLLSRLLSEHSTLRADGVDAAPGMLAAARRKLKPHLQQGRVKLFQQDLLTFLQGCADDTYDGVVTVNVLYAVADREAVITHLLRVIKPGGYLVINTSTRTGSGAIIREHLAHASWWSLLRPRLVGVFVIDSLINLFGSTGRFPFPSQGQLVEEVKAAGAEVGAVSHCYGGVNSLFCATKAKSSAKIES